MQAIWSKGRTDRFYVFIPLPLAVAIDLEAGEEFQWSLADRETLSVRRLRPARAVQVREKSAEGKKGSRK